MKKNIKALMTVGLASLTMLASCQKEDAPVCREPIQIKKVDNAFDKWLARNYVSEYNIEYKYKIDDSERDHKYVMPPAKLESAMKMSRLVHYAWLGTYDEVCGLNFMRQLSPRVITPYGAWAWEKESRVLATAEGGLKVQLYGLNELEKNLKANSIDVLNSEYFHTMHHEFTHILHQNKKAPVEFNTISSEGYSPAAWFNRTSKQSAPLGFVTPYAAKNTEEDLTEVTAAYITFTPAKWDEVFKEAGEDGSKMIRKKIEIMKKYMKDVWNIDMDVLRDVAKRRTSEIISQKDNLILEDWKPLLSNEFRSINAQLKEQKEREALISALAELHKDKSVNTSQLNCTIITHYLSH